MLCHTCDAHNDDTSRFCSTCGTQLGAVIPGARPPYTLNNTPITAATCPTCGRPNPAGARYCVYCATVLNKPVNAVQPVLQPVVQPIMQPVIQPVYAMAAAPTVMTSSFALTVTNPTSLVLRAVWFLAIGWWLGLVWTIFAWIFNLTLLGLPVGLKMLNMIPQVMTLQPRRQPQVHIAPGGTVMVVRQALEHPLPLRAIWFVIIGWWASLLWMLVAWAFSASILLLPIAFWMFNRVPTITTLAAEQ